MSRELDVHAGPRYSDDVLSEEEAERMLAEDAEFRSHVEIGPADEDTDDEDTP